MSETTSEASTKTVLVADDSRFYRTLLSCALEEAGYRCLVASSGKEALEAIEREAIDLLVLDLLMPGMNGFHVLESLRGHAASEALPVLVATQHGPNALEREILARHGVAAVLPKSASLERLLYEARGALFPQEREGRTARRAAVSIAVTARWEATVQLTTTFNLSERGMFLVLTDRDPPQPGDLVRLKLWVPGAERIFELDARTVWVNGAEGSLRRSHPPGFAVEYVEPGEDLVQALRTFLLEQVA